MMGAACDLIALFFKIVGAIYFFLSALFAGVALFIFIRGVVDEIGDWLIEWLAKKEKDR
jgi:hypothetical protein